MHFCVRAWSLLRCLEPRSAFGASGDPTKPPTDRADRAAAGRLSTQKRLPTPCAVPDKAARPLFAALSAALTMWLLTGRPKDPNAQGAPAPITILLPTAKPLENGGITYVVGRKDVDICIPADKSMSKTHAELMVSGEGFGSLTIRDMQSKLGVVVGESRLGAGPHALTDGARLKLGATLFTVQRVPLVLCTSGIAASERPALKAAAAKLGAALAKEWHDGVTHLVMPTVTWTPKLLTALAACVPVVSPAWVLAAAARSAATDPLPPIGAPEFAPTPAPTSATTAHLPSGATTIEGVQPERKRLFAGKTLLCLPNAADGVGPGGAAAATQDICRLLERMGAQTMPWPSPVPSSAKKLAAYIAARDAEGVWFLTSGDETKSVSREAEAVLTAGGTLYTPLLVRTSLARAALQAPVRQPTDRPAAKPAAKPIAKQAAPSAAVGKPASPPARAAAPPSRAPAADVTMAEAEDAGPAATSPHVPSGSSCEPASPADAQAATQVVEAQRDVSGPPPPAAAMARALAPAPAADKRGWNLLSSEDLLSSGPKRLKQSLGELEEPSADFPTPDASAMELTQLLQKLPCLFEQVSSRNAARAAALTVVKILRTYPASVLLKVLPQADTYYRDAEKQWRRLHSTLRGGSSNWSKAQLAPLLPIVSGAPPTTIVSIGCGETLLEDAELFRRMGVPLGATSTLGDSTLRSPTRALSEASRRLSR